MKFLEYKKKNNFIGLLRAILSFMVVLDHFYDEKKIDKIKIILYYHIPTFFILSFYYTHSTFAKFNINKIKLRFVRLILPYICWNTVSFMLNNIYHFVYKWDCFYTFYDYFKNILNGHMFIVSMWFQNIIIFTTLIIAILVFSFKNHYLLTFQIFMIFSYLFQYSGANYKLFNKYFPEHFRLTYGRFFECVPHSLTGFFLGIYNIPNKLSVYKMRLIIVCSSLLLFFSIYNFDSFLKGFKYCGLRLNFASVCIFLIFFSLDEVISADKIKLIKRFPNLTPGIYFIHNLVGRGILSKSILGNKLHSIYGIIIVYITSYIICLFLNKYIGNTKLRHLIK